MYQRLDPRLRLKTRLGHNDNDDDDIEDDDDDELAKRTSNNTCKIIRK